MSEKINGRYELQNEIGSGGMGAVFSAYDRLTAQTVALKRVQLNAEPQIVDSFAPHETQEQLRLVLAKEFQILAGLRHPNIISVLDYGFDSEQQPFYTMTFLEESETLLGAGIEYDFEGKIDLIEQLLQGLAYLHRRGILHRDIKPENVLVTDGVVHLLDFGLSHNAEEEGSMGGSPIYMAPELLMGKAPTRAADFFAVGILFYQLLTDQHPFGLFDAGFYERLLTAVPDYSIIDKRLHPILQSLLARSPDARPKAANELLKMIGQSLERSTILAETVEIRESYLQAATFVGREDEMAQLKDGLVRAKNEGGVMYLVGGESGVGKSRLLEEFRRHALVSGWQVLIGRETAKGEAPYKLWQSIIPRLAFNTDLNDFEVCVLQTIEPSLGHFLGRDIERSYTFGGNEGDQQLISTLISLIKRQARPTLIIFEDLHWSNKSLAPLKEMLKALQLLTGVMIVGSYRHDEYPQLPKELPGATLLQLERLSVREITQLSRAILGKGEVETDLVPLLMRETEGNTFFLIEVMRALAEEAGNLNALRTIELPREVFTSGMKALLQRRINKVVPDDLPPLQLAAVAGSQLNLNLFNRLNPEVDFDRWFQRVFDAAVFEVRDGQWFFSHDKLRQAVLAQMDSQELQMAHRRVACGIEALYPDQIQYYPALMGHWQAAGDNESELKYLIPVANRMIEIWADYSGGRELAARGLSLLPLSDPRRISLLNSMAKACAYRSEYGEGEALAQSAHTLAQTDENDLAQAISLNVLGFINKEQSRYSEASAFFQASLDISQRIKDQKNIANSLLQLGIIAEFQKNHTLAEERYRQSLAICRAIGEDSGTAKCLLYLGIIAAEHRNDPIRALDFFGQSLEMSRAIGDRRTIGTVLALMGVTNATKGAFQLARDYFQKSLKMRESIGDSVGMAHTYLAIGESYFFEGLNYSKVLHYQERSLQLLLDLNALTLVGINYGYISLSHVALGDFKNGVKAALSHFELLQKIELDKSNGLVHVALAKILSAIEFGDFDANGIQESINRITTLTDLPATPQAYIAEALHDATLVHIRLVVLVECGQLVLKLGTVDAAERYFLEARRLATKVKNQIQLNQIERLLGQMLEGAN